ncbi:polysaccharide biosynthesis C-terminal domain-containing protein [Pseudoxanthomonas suwonensis]|uniref:polysaccharide biosynthesis C-terminal domain-containing protein n=1 Tax=Pseudoxanthomonas suwonensis TaxID=314722 RepID=UPI00130D9DF5|nr:polysaccharide biosynthesis C-terminal domain-containing protein [Pseudoxanthomonas suwonensis]
MNSPGWETRLSALSLSGQMVAYALGIVLARQLGVAGFESYVVASAAFVLMVTLVPQGLEKYSLKLLPTLLDRGDAAGLLGFLRFSRRRVLLGALLVGGAVGLWASWTDGLSAGMRAAIVVSCVSLPAGALVHLGLEVLTALGRASSAALVFRLVVPAMALVLACIALAVYPGMPAAWAIAAWGLSWGLALALMAAQFRRAAPPGLFRTEPVERRRQWQAEARPFWLYRVSLAVLAQAAVLALEWLHPSPGTAVGAFAAAFSTAAIAQVLATATNRVYASRLSLLLANRDFDGIDRLRAERLRWLAAPLLVYLLVAFVFARELIGLFRPEFVAEGATALRILAVSTALTTLLAMAPTYLKHQGENRALFRGVATAAVLLMVLLAVLVPLLGVAGAAVAHAVASVFMYGNLARLAHRGLAQRQPGA